MCMCDREYIFKHRQTFMRAFTAHAQDLLPDFLTRTPSWRDYLETGGDRVTDDGGMDGGKQEMLNSFSCSLLDRLIVRRAGEEAGSYRHYGQPRADQGEHGWHPLLDLQLCRHYLLLRGVGRRCPARRKSLPSLCSGGMARPYGGAISACCLELRNRYRRSRNRPCLVRFFETGVLGGASPY